MRVIDPGHCYELRTLDGVADPQSRVLRFVKRHGERYPGNADSYPGTTSQEVLRALIDRGEYVNAQIPCAETEAATELMRAALFLLEARAARLHDRSLDLTTTRDLEDAECCRSCGHVGCVGTCVAAESAS